MSSEAERGRIADGPHEGVNELLTRASLVDHHTHSIVPGIVDRGAFMLMLTESDRRSAADTGGMDSQVGFAVRRWCAPLLDMPRHAPAEEYVERRLAMSNETAAARLLPHAGVRRMLVDSGFRPGDLLPVGELGRLAGARTETIVRLEAVAERVAVDGVPAAGFADAFRAALRADAARAVALKSIIAYRFGLDFDPARTSDREVAERAGAWFRVIETTGRNRLTDPVLLRFALWEGAATGLPLQIHTGYGDPDLDLHRCDPLLLTDFIRATEGTCPILLLHTYPFQRNAGYLAQMFPHVFVDVGLAVTFTGAASTQVVAESLELAPFTKILFSSDAWGLPELHLVGSWLFRRAMSRVLGGWVAAGDWSLADAERVVDLVGSGNARRVYGLAEAP